MSGPSRSPRGVILISVGVRFALTEVVHIGVGLSLLVIVGVMGGAIAAPLQRRRTATDERRVKMSWLKRRRQALVDEVSESYQCWRAACEDVRTAYRRWPDCMTERLGAPAK
jgi:hypothetical protein